MSVRAHGRLSRGWGLAGLVLFVAGPLFGCGTTDPLVVILQPWSSTDVWSIPGCPVQVGALVDERVRKRDLGSMGSRVVLTEDVMPWLRRAFEPLTGGAAITSSSLVSHPVTLSASLKKIYVQTLQSSVSGNVLLSVSYVIDDRPFDARVYRGTDTSVNWTGSAITVSSVLDGALAAAIKGIRADLLGLCQIQRSR
jgi:hypothetical protein